MPLISIRIVPSPTGTGSASEPPCRTRSSSIVRSAARAARPTSSGRVFRLVELLDDGQRDHDVVSPNEWTHVGSAISTDVSRTIRVRCAGRRRRRVDLRARLGSDRSHRGAPGRAWTRSVTATPHRHPSASPSGSRGSRYPNGSLLYPTATGRWWMVATVRTLAGASWRRERDLRVLRHRRAARSPPTSSGATTSRWRSSIDLRCSTATRSSFRAATSLTLPDLTVDEVGPFFERVRIDRGRDARCARRAGNVRGQQQRRQPERRPPARARRAAHARRWIARVLLAASSLRATARPRRSRTRCGASSTRCRRIDALPPRIT